MRSILRAPAHALVLALTTATLAPAMAGSDVAHAQAMPNTYVEAGMIVVSAIDRYEMAGVWEAASPVMKGSVPQERFIANIAQKRALLGAIRSREWLSVMKLPVTAQNGGLPPGQYVSVRFATTGANGRTMEEVISFRLDDDAQWRLVGYSLN